MKTKLGLAVMFFALSSLVLGSGAMGTAHAAPGQGTLYGLIAFTNELIVVNPGTGAAGLPLQLLDDNGTTCDDPILDPNGFCSDDFFIGFGTPSLAIDPTSGIMYMGTGSGLPLLYTVNPSTGEATFQCDLSLDPFGFNLVAIDAMAFDSNGNLYASVNDLGFGGNGGADSFIQMDTACNILNGPIPYGLTGLSGLAFDSNDILYGSSTTGQQQGQLFTINTGSGVPTPIGLLDQSGGIPFTLTGGVASLQFDCFGGLLGGTGKGGQLQQSDLVTINPLSGAASVVGVGGTVLFNTMGGLAFDQTCPSGLVGGELIPIDSAALLVAGAQSSVSWMVALAASVIGIGALVIKKKFI